MIQQAGSGILKTKQHFDILDGLRGIAAVAIVVFHFMEVVYTDYSKNFIGHGFLAVDFFFCLSGFVIAYAYDDRIKKIGLLEFFKSRIIRLHPLVIFGSVLGLVSFLFDPFGGHPELYSAGEVLLLFLSSLLLIPVPVMEDRFFNLFGLNAPAWSLFWEYIANVLYAFILYKISRRYLLVLTLLAAAALCFAGYQANSLMGGWGKENFWDGGARISYSFLAGLLIYRSNWIIKTTLGFAGLSVLLILPFIMPWSDFNWLIELPVVLLYFPLLIALGAGAVLTPGLKKICVFSGRISYPLYMTHYAVIWAFANYYNSHKPGSTQLFFIINISTILLLGLAWLAMTFYDIPVRKYLTARRKNP
ncbi:MAG: acyltransferase [Chitinophagaceae bacterium]